ncbi:hypothetical protein [Spartinivicinus poritis]|uniref:GNAT family N-acetyltransferase n=1 Tax=Spartinivicinus poritis TaxID=2994640 RepID=A0ABT5UGR9_9GAMM|nr:hypothetical protein [Spartinivicinus sp. A2-2]MDE1465588.1 hypothetical protein [Spartinivicinus sp. A2-2]
MARKYSKNLIDEPKLNENDFSVMEKLYRQLYIDKHNQFNPKYNTQWFEEVYRLKYYTFRVFKEDKDILAFVIFYKTSETIFPLIVGYDRSNENKKLYEILFGSLLKDSLSSNLELFLSGGASSYKKNRGTETHFEFEAVYYDHLPLHRKLPWKLIKLMYDKFAQRIYSEDII